MDNYRIINLTIKFKDRIKQEIENTMIQSNDMKEWLWKLLIMAEIAHRSFELKINIESSEKHYFERQAAIGRYFCDWSKDWIAQYYYEISNYVAKFYWPGNDKEFFKNEYIPFSTFNLD